MKQAILTHRTSKIDELSFTAANRQGTHEQTLFESKMLESNARFISVCRFIIIAFGPNDCY